MSKILRNVQQASSERWVGLSVIHLGDRDVPNALVFIDKYTQIPRLLSPIGNCIHMLQDLNMHASTSGSSSGTDSDGKGAMNQQLLDNYVKAEWGSIDGVVLQILSDFYKHGFDGSGMTV